MTACHESGGFRTRIQDAGGPARSFYQIEPDTLKDLHENWLSYRPDRLELIKGYKPKSAETYGEALMDDTFATVAARLIYFRVPQPIPNADDDIAMAEYWKTFWNTHLGKGTVDKFLTDWVTHRPDFYS